MFSKNDLKKLIIPLIVEQILAVTVGMTDTIMVAGKGESAVAGVSLVDSINILIIGLFSALATGGAVVAAQYIGHKEKEKASEAANQLILTVAFLAVIITMIAMLFNHQILHLLYSKANAEVITNARIYFYITALSFPFIAIYNAGAALFRAMRNSKISMYVSLWMNIIHIIGNAVLMYVFGMGAEGAAIATLFSRILAAVIVTIKLRNPVYDIHIDSKFKFKINMQMIRRILHIGIPNGLENSMFQFGKILVSGMLAGLGTSAIAANQVAGTVAGLEVIPGSAIGLAMLTVVGQCVGANNPEQVRKYTWRLLKYAYVAIFLLNIIVLIFIDPICSIFNLKEETEQLAKQLMIYHSFCCIIIWPSSFTLPNALRAANDVKFTMYVAIGSMWVWRIAFSYLLIKTGYGVMGVWIAMTIDWSFRACLFLFRFKREGWRKHSFREENIVRVGN